MSETSEKIFNGSKNQLIIAPPPDRLHLVYVKLFIAGIGTLLPWNFFITAIPYFQYKLRNISVDNGSEPHVGSMSAEQILFGNYLALCSMVPLSACNMLNLMIMKRIPLFVRYIIGSSLVFLMLLLTVILVKFDLDAKVFLGITLLSVVLINCGAAMITGSVMGMASLLPQKNMSACLEGQAVAGVVAAIAQIASIGTAHHPESSALAYFLFAMGFLTLSAALTLMLTKNAHFVYYWRIQNTLRVSETSDIRSNGDLSTELMDSKKRSFTVWSSLRAVWVHGLCGLLTLMFTLALFPALLQPIKSMNFKAGDRWTDTFFSPVIVFLSYSIFDWIGRNLAGLIKWPRRDQKWILLALCVARVIFIPICLFMNQQPRSHLPVLLLHDAYPIMFVILLGLTNGYLLTAAMMFGPSFAQPGNSEGAGVALSIYMALGLSFGVAVSVGLALLI